MNPLSNQPIKKSMAELIEQNRSTNERKEAIELCEEMAAFYKTSGANLDEAPPLKQLIELISKTYRKTDKNREICFESTLNASYNRLIEEMEKIGDSAPTPNTYGIELILHLSGLINFQEKRMEIFNKDDSKSVLHPLIFSIKDYLYRLTEKKDTCDKALKIARTIEEFSVKIHLPQEVIDLGKELNRLAVEFIDISRFEQIKITQSSGGIATFDISQAKKDSSPKRENKRMMKVISLVPYSWLQGIGGGVQSVLQGLASGFNSVPLCKQRVVNCCYYDKYQMGLNLVFKGTFEHFADGIVEDQHLFSTSLYKVKNSPVWLLYPNGASKRFMENGMPYGDITPIREIMNTGLTIPYTSMRMNAVIPYYSSAMAMLSLIYKGKNGNGRFDLVRSDDTTFSATVFPLIKKVFNPLRKELGLPALPLMNVWHNLIRVGDPSPDMIERNKKYLQKIGFKEENTKDNGELMAKYSDVTVFVGEGQKADFYSDDINLNKGMQAIYKEQGGYDKTCTIQNCIDVERYDLQSEIGFGKGSWEKLGGNYYQWRRNVMEMLYAKGKLASNTRWPIMTFTARFGEEKGTKTLVRIAHFVHKIGAQFVIIGTGDTPLLEKWKGLAAGPLKDSLTIMGNLKEQEERFDGVSRAQWTRGAAALSIQPSFLEACGLAPMEDLVMGKVVVGTYTQGLTVLLEPIDLETSNSVRAAIRFHAEKAMKTSEGEMDEKTNLEMESAIQKAFDRVKEMEDKGPENYNQEALTIHKYAMENFSFWHRTSNGFEGNLKKYVEMYYKLTNEKGNNDIILLELLEKQLFEGKIRNKKHVIEVPVLLKQPVETSTAKSISPSTQSEPIKKEVTPAKSNPAPVKKEAPKSQDKSEEDGMFAGLKKGFYNKPTEKIIPKGTSLPSKKSPAHLINGNKNQSVMFNGDKGNRVRTTLEGCINSPMTTKTLEGRIDEGDQVALCLNKGEISLEKIEKTQTSAINFHKIINNFKILGVPDEIIAQGLECDILLFLKATT